MSHAVTSAPSMAFTNNSRSFTNLGSAAAAGNAATTSNVLAPFGHTGSTWRSGNIWGSGSLTNGFTSKAVTRDNSQSRDIGTHNTLVRPEEIEGKTGSGSLVDSSTLDDWSYRSAHGVKRAQQSSRSPSEGRYLDASAAQQRSLSNTGLQSSFGAVNLGSAPLTSRAPTITLNANSTTVPRSGFGSNPTYTRRGTEQPPNVYTKFDQPSEPNHKKPDSAIGSWADAVALSSPADIERLQTAKPFGRAVSMPAPREPNAPSARRDMQPAVFTKPDYSQVAQKWTPSSSREPSISSQNGGAYTGFALHGLDHINTRFAQTSLNGDSRPSTSYKSADSNGHSDYSNKFGSPWSRTNINNGAMNGYEGVDEVDEVDPSNLAYLSLDAYPSPPYSDKFAKHNGLGSANRFLPTSIGADHRNGYSFHNANIPNRSFGTPTGPRVALDWQGYSNGALAMSRRAPGVPESPPYLDPRVQQMLAAQIQSQYVGMYNPYTMPFGTPYVPQLQVPMPGAEVMDISSLDLAPGEGLQSILLYEFRNNTKTKRYELKDIYDHVAEFAGDQHGSRFIQTKLETANSDEKDRVFREIQPNAIQLMTDVFGNYVIQKFFEHGDQTHKKILANQMRGQVLNLSLQMYGCRVVQKALDHVLVDQQALLIGELETHVLKCVKDQNGNHVIQKAIERCPAHTIGFIIDAFRGQVPHLSIHPYGCRVIQRCLERCDTPSKALIMAELMDGIQGMIADPYGNYVVQNIVQKDEGPARQLVLQIVGKGLEGYSKHKFASNVVEKCIERASDAWRREGLYTLSGGIHRRVDGESPLLALLNDQYGNYVIQKMLDTLCHDDYLTFIDMLQPAMNHAKRTGCGKQILAIEKKMHRYPSYRHNSAASSNGPGAVGSFLPGPFQRPLPTPPFASHFASVANTPPPLGSMQSLHSSNLPSFHGDAVEGAAASRKGSEPSTDGGNHYR